MRSSLSRQEFLRSEIGDFMRGELKAMIDNPEYNTSYRCIDDDDFITKHMDYMSQYPNLEPGQYILNLKLKLRSNNQQNRQVVQSKAPTIRTK